MLSRKIKKKSVVPRWQPYVFIAPFFIIYIAFSLFPVLYSFVISLYQWDGIGEKAYIGFQNYMTLFTKDNLFFKSVGNTFLIMSVPLPVLVIGGTMLASLINSKFVRGKRLFQTINFLPYLTAPVAVGILFGLMFDQQNGVVNEALKSMGLLNEGLYWLKDGYLARIVVMIMCTWKYMGYYMVLLLAGITSISSDIYEAARIDGAGMVTTFFRITLPLMKNTLTFVIIQGMIGSLQLVEDPMTLLTGWISGGQSAVAGGPDRSSLTMMWYMYDTGFGTNMNYGYAASIAYATFIIIAIFAFIINILLVRFRKITKLRSLFTTGHVQVQQASTAYWLILFALPGLLSAEENFVYRYHAVRISHLFLSVLHDGYDGYPRNQ